jgi:hypothetical protein
MPFQGRCALESSAAPLAGVLVVHSLLGGFHHRRRCDDRLKRRRKAKRYCRNSSKAPQMEMPSPRKEVSNAGVQSDLRNVRELVP